MTSTETKEVEVSVDSTVSFKDKVLKRAQTERLANDEEDANLKAIMETERQIMSTQFSQNDVNYFNDETLSDIRILVKTEDNSRSYFAHKAVLALKSEYFRTLFFGTAQWIENETGVLELLPGLVDLDLLEEFFKFFYTGKITLRKTNIWTLYFLADQYIVDNLKKLLSTFICKTVLNKSVLIEGTQTYTYKHRGLYTLEDAVEFTQHYQDNEVATSAGAAIHVNLRDVDEASFNNFSLSTILAILTAKTLQSRNTIDEFQLLKRVLGWIKADSDREQYTEQVLMCIRYGQIEFNEQMKAIARHKTFVSSEKLSRVVALTMQERVFHMERSTTPLMESNALCKYFSDFFVQFLPRMTQGSGQRYKFSITNRDIDKALPK